jgi:hypothetical protein
VLLASPLLALVVLELSLRAAHDLGGGLAGWLYMSGARRSYAGIDTLPGLIASTGLSIEPYAVSGDFILNSRALRTPEYADEATDGTTRLVVLGDSHSWASGGVPFTDLWHSRLRAALAERVPGGGVELINLSVPAVGPEFELRMWELEGARLAPAVVILAVSVGTDFLEADVELADQDVVDRWARRSYVVRLARNVVRLCRAGGVVPGSPAMGEPAPRDADRRGGFVRDDVVLKYDRDAPRFPIPVEEHHRLLQSRLVICDTRPGQTTRFERACRRVATILRLLDKSVTEHGARLVVLLIPDEPQVDAGLLAVLAGERGTGLADLDVERPQRRLRELCAEEGILCVDALSALRVRAAEDPVFHPHETHLNDRGHAILAERMLAALLEHDVLP